jgi:flavin reductase (DIM6/NTAB) family NADH-FMN oxidoreductase RutF
MPTRGRKPIRRRHHPIKPSSDKRKEEGFEEIATTEFRTIEPKILYFGSPVALIGSLTEDGSTNLAPMASFWALGWTLVLGLLDETKTAENLERHPECVVNVPSPEMWPWNNWRR